MATENIAKLLEIVKEKNIIDQGCSWSNGSSTYFSEIKLELDEVAEEIKSGRQCYLEDELGDVLWDYLNLLICLEHEGKASVSKVFERSLNKYRERVDGISRGESWLDIKQRQKKRLADEQSSL